MSDDLKTKQIAQNANCSGDIMPRLIEAADNAGVFDPNDVVVSLGDAYDIAAQRIVELEEANAELLTGLETLRDHVAKHACVWDDAINGSHHHPIWPNTAELLAKHRPTAGEGGES